MKTIRHIWTALFGRLRDQYYDCLRQEIRESFDSVLDVGCGCNSPLRCLHSRPKLIVGVDAFGPAIEESRAQSIHDEYYEISVLSLCEHFTPKSFDCVVALDVIEHLKEEDALNLISQMETIARKSVLIFTPNGFLPQGEERGNPLQKHLSGWTTRQMRDLGYRVVGIEGLRCLRKELANIRFRPHWFWLTISLLTQSFTTNRPRLAFRLLCTKDLAAVQEPGPGLRLLTPKS